MAIENVRILLLTEQSDFASYLSGLLKEAGSFNFTLDVAAELSQLNYEKENGNSFLIVGAGCSNNMEYYPRFEKLDFPYLVLTDVYDKAADAAAAAYGADGFFVKNEISAGLLVRLIRFALKSHTAKPRMRTLPFEERAVFDAVPSGFLFVQYDGLIYDLNDRAAELIGIRSREELQGKNCLDFVYEPDRLEMAKRLRIVCNPNFKGRIPRSEFRILRIDGSFFYAESTANPIIDSKSDTSAVLLAIRDISEQKTIRESLIKAKEEAEHASQLKSFFLANMSHEIRTPLNGILGFTDLLFEEAERIHNKTMTQFLNKIQKSSERLLRTLTEIIDISRIEADKVELKIGLVFIGDIIEKVVDLKLPEAAEKGLNITTQIEDTCAVQGDTEKLQQIIENIIDNAIKYSESGSVRVETGYAEQGSYIFLKVIDTGIGISEQYMAKIFEPFSQEYSGYARAYEGNGLGLSITKRLVDMMKGEISLKSRKGAGTLVTVSFPAVTESRRPKRKYSTAAKSKSGAATAFNSGERPHILIVDNDQDNRDFLEIALINIFTVNTAGSADEALLIAEQFYRRGRIFDLMIFSEKPDQHLNGEELLILFKEKWDEYIQIPIVVQLSFDSKTDREYYLDQGFSNILLKPASREKLVEALEDEVRKFH